MAQAFLPGEVLAITAQAADRLLKLDSGDAALLYLHLLRHGGRADKLKWTPERLQNALEQLRAQGLAPSELTAPAPPEPPILEAPPPEYTTEDVTQALADQRSTFPTLVDEVERRLGKRLSPADLKRLYILYDHLALPAEVILMLVGWCIEEMEQKYGPGRKPFLSRIEKEGFIWKRRGIDTLERAEEHIRKLTHLRGREAEIFKLLELDITARAPTVQEKNFIAAWDDMGFEDEAISMAYERTIMRTRSHSLQWNYMNKILLSWHGKGLHTAAAIRAGDQDPRPTQTVGKRKASQPPAGQESRAREDMEHMRRLMEEMKQEGN